MTELLQTWGLVFGSEVQIRAWQQAWEDRWNRPEDVLKLDADEDGGGGDDAADALR